MYQKRSFTQKQCLLLILLVLVGFLMVLSLHTDADSNENVCTLNSHKDDQQYDSNRVKRSGNGEKDEEQEERITAAEEVLYTSFLKNERQKEAEMQRCRRMGSIHVGDRRDSRNGAQTMALKLRAKLERKKAAEAAAAKATADASHSSFSFSKQ